MKKKVIYIVLGVVFLMTFNVSITSAAEFLIADKGGNISVGSDETIKNLYTAGNIVTIDGNIQKSLHAAGNIVTVNGDVESSICAGANTLVVNGNVGGTIHAAGSAVVIKGEVTDDLIIAGGNIAIAKSAKIGGDLIVAGGTVDIQGPVAGKLLVSGGQVTLNSKVDGEIKIETGLLVLGPQAEIISDLKYTAPEEAEINESAIILGAVDYTQQQAKGTYGIIFSVLTIVLLVKLLIMIISGLILVYLFGNLTKPVVKEALVNFWPSLGIGFAALILMPIAAVLFAITVLGLWLAGLIGVVYILMLMLASPIASIVLGTWLLGVISKKEAKEIGWRQVVIGAIALGILTLIPFIGWLIGLAMMLVSLGALYRLTHRAIVVK